MGFGIYIHDIPCLSLHLAGQIQFPLICNALGVWFELLEQCLISVTLFENHDFRTN